MRFDSLNVLSSDGTGICSGIRGGQDQTSPSSDGGDAGDSPHVGAGSPGDETYRKLDELSGAVT